MKYESMPRAELIAELCALNTKFNRKVSEVVEEGIKQKESEFRSKEDKYEETLKSLYVTEGYKALSSAYFCLKASKPWFVFMWNSYGDKYDRIQSAAEKLRELLESVVINKGANK